MGFKVKVGRVGHSIKISIPKPIADSLGIEEGDELELEIVGSKIRIELGK